MTINHVPHWAGEWVRISPDWPGRCYWCRAAIGPGEDRLYHTEEEWQYRPDCPEKQQAELARQALEPKEAA